MSDKLAVSAAFSVLMMVAFVLFGPGATQADFAPESLRTPTGFAASADASATGTSFLSVN
ncbi:MAG: hypothetical protein FJX31_07135 [Alphaproteobacteria bacterium]|nr:hypothetical protein [Alphaproteobacteria bacterium]